LVSVDADSYTFALLFIDIITSAIEGYLWYRFQMCFTKRLRAQVLRDILIGVITEQKHGRLALLMNLKKYSLSDVILLQWPTCPPWSRPQISKDFIKLSEGSE